MRLLSGIKTLETLLQVFTKCLTSNGKIMLPGKDCFFQQIEITCHGVPGPENSLAWINPSNCIYWRHRILSNCADLLLFLYWSLDEQRNKFKWYWAINEKLNFWNGWKKEFSHENGCCLAPPNIRLILEQYAEKKIVEKGAIEPRGNEKQEKF